MNRVIASVYALTIGGGDRADYTPEMKDKLIALIPSLMDEVSRMDAILRDPFIRGYLDRFGPSTGKEPQP
jgi:hypothetical protein